MALVKWAGAKSRQASAITTRLPTCGAFIEPFCGTAAVGLSMARQGKCQSLVLSDVNSRLIDLFQAVKLRPGALTAIISGLVAQYNAPSTDREALYGEWRDLINSDAFNITTAATFVLINRTNFNGLYRENASGKYNVGWGKYESVKLDHLVKGVQELHQDLNRVPTTIYCGDYQVAPAQPGAVVYADSPYDGTFGSYHKVKWGDAQQAKLACHLRALAEQLPGRVFASNSDTARVRDLYRGSIFHSFSGETSISCKSATRGLQREVFIEVCT